MHKEVGINMGANLGFIEKIVLINGTVLENTHVLYAAPIPNHSEIETMFRTANEVSISILGHANHEWSAYPETMKNHRMFKRSHPIFAEKLMGGKEHGKK